METPLNEFFSLLASQNQPLVLATIAACKGSTPGKAGFKMIVKPDSSTLGTVGGGALEEAVIVDALKLLGSHTPQLKTYSLTEQGLGMWCGGEVTVLLEPLGPPIKLWIFGYGHIGREVRSLVESLLFEPIVVHNAKLSKVKHHVVHWTSLEPFPQVQTQDFVLLLTMDAAVELELLARLAACKPRYLGVIGSRRKAAKLKQALAERGVAADGLNLHMPVGLDIRARSPKEIAISIVAELIRERNA